MEQNFEDKNSEEAVDLPIAEEETINLFKANSQKKEIAYDDANAFRETEDFESKAFWGLSGVEEKHKREAEAVIEASGVKRGDLVIDTCSGVGDQAELMCKNGLDVIALEYSPKCVEEIKDKLGEGSVAFQGSLQNMKEICSPSIFLKKGNEKKVNAIFNCGDSTIYLNPKEQIKWLKDCHEMLEEGGKLVLQFRFNKNDEVTQNSCEFLSKPMQDHEDKLKEAYGTEYKQIEFMEGVKDGQGKTLYFLKNKDDADSSLDKSIPDEFGGGEIPTFSFDRALFDENGDLQSIFSTGVMYEYTSQNEEGEKRNEKSGKIIDEMLRAAGFSKIERKSIDYHEGSSSAMGLIIAEK